MPRHPRHARRSDSARARDVAHRHGARALPQPQARVCWTPVPESIQGRSERGRRAPPQRDPKCARKSTRGWNPSRTRSGSMDWPRDSRRLARPTRHAPHFATSCGTGRPRRATRRTVHPRPFTFRSQRPKPAVCHASSAPPTCSPADRVAEKSVARAAIEHRAFVVHLLPAAEVALRLGVTHAAVLRGAKRGMQEACGTGVPKSHREV
jgi:hypothetical protein